MGGIPGGGPAGPSTGDGSSPHTRGPSATRVLEIDWDYPVYAEKAQGETTVAKAKRSALPAEEAFAFLAGDDPRPLLVIRECKVCNGTDRALLTPGADNERTMLLARWFHCVKLPPDVRDADHPFAALFPRKDAEHLFVASRDGSLRIPLESEGSRVELWKSMTRVVQADYERSADAALKKIARLLDEYDVLDERRSQLETKRDAILEEEGQNSRKLAKVFKDLAAIDAELAGLNAELEKAGEIGLLRPAEPAAGAADSAG